MRKYAQSVVKKDKRFFFVDSGDQANCRFNLFKTIQQNTISPKNPPWIRCRTCHISQHKNFGDETARSASPTGSGGIPLSQLLNFWVQFRNRLRKG